MQLFLNFNLKENYYFQFCLFVCFFFLKIANGKQIWIVSDIRRKTDIKWFKDNYGQICKTIKISCSEETRKSRGWNFVAGKKEF